MPAQAGTFDPGILSLLDLEIWGAPISRPVADPNNSNFVYKRFQRGTRHARQAGQAGVFERVLPAPQALRGMRPSHVVACQRCESWRT